MDDREAGRAFYPPQDIQPSPAPARKKRNGPQTKKRKINTCSACKTRKVKCDRVRPTCGPCEKHYGKDAFGSCNWAMPADDDQDEVPNPRPSQNTSAASPNDFANQSAAFYPSSSASYGPPPRTQAETSNVDTQILLDRIVRLEFALEQRRVPLPTFNPPPPIPPSQVASTSSFQDNTPTWNSYQINPTAPPASLADSIRFPFAFNPTDGRTNEIISFLPDPSTSDFLLQSYANVEKTFLNQGLSWRLIYMQLDILRNQLAQPGTVPRVDFSFLALLFILLAAALEFSDLQPLVDRGIATSDENAVQIMKAWVQVTEACLCMADFMSYPNLNILMCLAILRQHQAGRSIPSLKTILSISIRLAQTMGLHKLGSAKEDEERWIAASAAESSKAYDDRINPVTSKSSGARGRDLEVRLLNSMGNDAVCGMKGVYTSDSHIVDRSHLVRETARRLWFGLVSSDYYVSSGFGDDQFQINKYNTIVPLNIDEEDLPNLGPESFKLPRELPPGSPSESSIYPWTNRIITVGKEASRTASPTGHFTFEQTMQIDLAFRKIFDDLPTFLRLDGISETLPEVQVQMTSRPYLALQRLFLHESIFNRLTMLHRHFLARGHRDEQYEQSTHHCVKAAKMVLYCRREVERIYAPAMRFFVFKIHVFVSISALCIHLIELARQGIQNSETAELRREITEGLEFINSARAGTRSSRSASPVSTEATKKMIDALLRAETQVQQSEPSSSNVEVNGKEREKGNGNFEGILSPDDPLNLYINSLLDPDKANGTSLSPPDFFDVLDGFVPR